MKLERIVDTESDLFKQVWEVYEESFPIDERRSLEKQKQAMENERYTFSAVHMDDQFVGLMGTWDLNTYAFLEHYAIKKELQNQGRGTRVMIAFMGQRFNIVGEVEIPIKHPRSPEEKKQKKDSTRRISFYRSLGFKVNQFPYVQPAYEEGKNSVPMHLMTYPHESYEKEFLKIKEMIHKEAYGLEKALE